MIEVVEGLPGSGKSYYACLRIVDWCHEKRGWVRTNIAGFKADLARILSGNPDAEIVEDVDCWQGWKLPPGPGLVVVDEAQEFFDARHWKQTAERDKDERGMSQSSLWLAEHRKSGHEIVMVTHSISLLDKLIRERVACRTRVRSTAHLRFLGFGLPHLMVANQFAGDSDVRLGTRCYRVRGDIGALYDTTAGRVPGAVVQERVVGGRRSYMRRALWIAGLGALFLAWRAVLVRINEGPIKFGSVNEVRPLSLGAVRPAVNMRPASSSSATSAPAVAAASAPLSAVSAPLSAVGSRGVVNSYPLGAIGEPLRVRGWSDSALVLESGRILREGEWLNRWQFVRVRNGVAVFQRGAESWLVALCK